MMLTTHVLLGVLLSIPLAIYFPEHAPLIITTALIGGSFPDLDIFIGDHRRTFHYPIALWPLTGLLGLAALYTANPILITAHILTLTAAAHAFTDIFGGGLERTPWNKTATKSVYNHVTQHWIQPKHIIHYDGSPGDFALTIIFSVLIVLYPRTRYLWHLTLLCIITGFIYTVARKQFPRLETWLHHNAPPLRPFLNSLH